MLVLGVVFFFVDKLLLRKLDPTFRNIFLILGGLCLLIFVLEWFGLTNFGSYFKHRRR